MTEKELAVCDECGSLFFKGSSQMMGLCPECAHILYGYPNCDHHFQDGRCVNCYWDGSESVYIKKLNQQEETDMPTTEWLNKYESIKDKLTCKVDLEAHFTEKVIGNMAVDVLDIGTVHFPTGQIFACDPLVELEDTLPFLQTLPAGTYPVKICVVPSEQYGDHRDLHSFPTRRSSDLQFILDCFVFVQPFSCRHISFLLLILLLDVHTL